MTPWSAHTHFGGFDWASDHHDVIVVDKAGTIVAKFAFEESATGWHEFVERTKGFPSLALTIETCSGAVVERLLQTRHTVYPVNPKQAQRYRDRKAPSGVKTDRLDAWSFADALRLDGHSWKALSPEDPMILELRQLCRDEVALIEQRTVLINQVRAALREYYPTALAAFEDWTSPSAWAFVEAFPTPQALVAAGRRKWEKFLHTHRLYRPETAERRLTLFAQATQFCGSEATTSAKSLLALTLAKMLRTLDGQLDTYRGRIEALFARHPDHDIFGSLPGPGKKIAPRLLSELGSDRARFNDPEGLQCYAGTAPASYQSGKMRKAHVRRACNKHLRFAVHWLSDLSREKCAWADAYYQQKKAEGKTHATALRCLGQRWLKILWKMWQTRSVYDADLHQRNQVRHGSWVLQLLNPTKSVATT